MNSHNGDTLHLDNLRERKKLPHDKQVGENNAGENVSLEEDNNKKKTFGKTPDGAGE